MLRLYIWPGNVRELRHQISRAVLLSKSESITALDLALPVQINQLQASYSLESPVQIPVAQSEPMDNGTDAAGNSNAAMPEQYVPQVTLDSAEKMMIENALKFANHNVSEAARQLGITRMAMRYRMEKHGIHA